MIKTRLGTVCPSCGKTNIYKYKSKRGYTCRSYGNTFTKPKTKEMEYSFNSLPFALIHIMEEKKKKEMEIKKVIIEKPPEKQTILEPITSMTSKQQLAMLMRSLR